MDPNSKWIAEQLTMHRLQQKDLASALGLDPSGVTRLLRGQRKLRPDEIPLVLRFFGQFNESTSAPPSRLLRALSLKGVEVEELARRTGIVPSRLLQIKYGQGPAAEPRERAEISAAFGTSSDFLFSDEPVPSGAHEGLREGWRKSAQETPASARLGSSQGIRLPVYRPLPRQGGGWYEALFVLAERREPPTSLRDAAGGFGVFVDDTWLSPFLLPGEVFWVHPGRPALEGSRVLARRPDGSARPGLLEFRGGTRLISTGREPTELDQTARLEAIVAIDAR